MDVSVGDGVDRQLRQLRIGLDDRRNLIAHAGFLELNEHMCSVREAVGLTCRIGRAREDGLGLGDRGMGFREPVGKIGSPEVFDVGQDFQHAEQSIEVVRLAPNCFREL